MAEQLVNTLADSFQPEKYSDTYRENLMRIIDAKLKGKKIEVDEPEEPEATNVIDLMARLQESLAQGKKAKKGKKAAAADEETEAKAEEKAEAKPKKKRRKTA